MKKYFLEYNAELYESLDELKEIWERAFYDSGHLDDEEFEESTEYLNELELIEIVDSSGNYVGDWQDLEYYGFDV